MIIWHFNFEGFHLIRISQQPCMAERTGAEIPVIQREKLGRRDAEKQKAMAGNPDSELSPLHPGRRSSRPHAPAWNWGNAAGGRLT